MSKIDREPQDIDEKAEKITFALDDKILTSEVITRLDDFKTKLSNRYDDVKMSLERRSKTEIDIIIHGSRKETKDELAARILKEEAEEKFVKGQQLKEYLKLKKIFGDGACCKDTT